VGWLLAWESSDGKGRGSRGTAALPRMKGGK